nr:hypothetical protein [Synergistaceae bacterium]
AFNLSPRSWGKALCFKRRLNEYITSGLCDALPNIDTPEDISAFLNLNQLDTHTANMLNSLN